MLLIIWKQRALIVFIFTTTLFLNFIVTETFAQDAPTIPIKSEIEPLALDKAILLALKNNPQIKMASLEVEQQKVLRKAAYDIPKTKISLVNGQNNSAFSDNYWGISQEFQFPTVYMQQNKVQKMNVTLSEKNLIATQSQLIRNVKLIYNQLLFMNEKLKISLTQEDNFKNFAEKAELKWKAGETSYLESLAAKNNYQEVQLERKQVESEINIGEQELQKLLNMPQRVTVIKSKFEKLVFLPNIETINSSKNPMLAYYFQKISIADSQISLERKKFLPDFSIGAFNQPSDGEKGFQLEVSIPIFFGSQKGKVQAAKIQSQIAQYDYENYQNEFKNTCNRFLQEHQKFSDLMNYYDSAGLKQAEEILTLSNLSYLKGEIGYVEYIQNLMLANKIKNQYLEYLSQYNQTIINIEYLMGEK